MEILREARTFLFPYRYDQDEEGCYVVNRAHKGHPFDATEIATGCVEIPEAFLELTLVRFLLEPWRNEWQGRA
jgi:hypothetical protein